MENKFRTAITKYKISPYYSQKLMILKSYEIAFIFDDSGSMCSILNDSPLNTDTFKATRWQELQYFANISVKLVNAINSNGCNVHFLNRDSKYHVQDMKQLWPCFDMKPTGYTPLTSVMNLILYENSKNNNNLLIVIVTDGGPTDNTGRSDIITFKRCLQTRPENVFTSIVTCTDEAEAVGYLYQWNKTIPRLDVIDDYRNEKKKKNKLQSGAEFTFGDYVAMSLVGSIDQSVNTHDSTQDCCVLL
jgi:hypothetical protein